MKATIVRITRRGGWAVLNADDPRVWAMRRQTRAGWYAFSLEPDSPGVREALARGGRAAIIVDGMVTLLREGGRTRRIAPVAELPVTFGGLSTYNVANALAAAAAADALGFTAKRIAAGLRTFELDTGANPGRLNLYERRGRLVLIDFAHNEAGLQGLLDVSRQLTTRPGGGRRGKVRLALGTAGDRTDEILRNLGRLAGAGADDVVICEKRHYLRGRDLGGMNRILRGGVKEGGFTGKVEALPSELAALQALEKRARKGDVVAVMTHVERAEIAAWLTSAGYQPVPLRRLRELLSAD